MIGGQALRFTRACIATPHYLASAAGHEVLASGGNALDAAVAASLTLGVVTPYLCGYGGDLFALVWHEGKAHAYLSGGKAPASATPVAVREALARSSLPDATMPFRGAMTVTVPGAVRGWFDLLERFGTRSFGSLAARPLAYAAEGFALTAKGTLVLSFLEDDYRGFDEWHRVYGGAGPRGFLVQADLARTIKALGADGPDAYYAGSIADAIGTAVGEGGGLLTAGDLEGYQGAWADSIHAPYRDVEILELPPYTQGVAALEALRIVEAHGAIPSDAVDRQHLLIEAIKLALSDLDAHVTDPATMRIDPEQLLSDTWTGDRAGALDMSRAGIPRPGTPLLGGTAYLCAADADGMVVSMIQTNFNEFGSGVTVPGWGINLTNRGRSFSVDPDHVNVVAPGKHTLHTLIPAMALREGNPWLAFGTSGADGQPQTHLQFLTRVVDDGADLQQAIEAPRWRVDPANWSVRAEARLPADVVDGLRERGHALELVGDWWDHAGYLQAVAVGPDGPSGAGDPRAESAVVGF